jgi:hypothetical protein
MTLPVVPIPTDTVAVGDGKVEVRALSRSEVLKLGNFKEDVDAAEVFILARGTGYSEDDVIAWREQCPAGAISPVVDRIVEMSGLTEEASKSKAEGAG